MRTCLPPSLVTVAAAFLLACGSPSAPGEPEAEAGSNIETAAGPAENKQDSVLRHVVLFRFAEQTSREDLALIESTFNALPAKIPEILDYEWGINNSPEGLDQGYTHAYLITFLSEADRAAYLPHPDHVAFTEVVGPHVDAVHVVDYWSRGEEG